METTKTILPVKSRLTPVWTGPHGCPVRLWHLVLPLPMADDGQTVEQRLYKASGLRYLLVSERQEKDGTWHYLFEFDWKGD
jgi:hypothetical protein